MDRWYDEVISRILHEHLFFMNTGNGCSIYGETLMYSFVILPVDLHR